MIGYFKGRVGDVISPSQSRLTDFIFPERQQQGQKEGGYCLRWPWAACERLCPSPASFLPSFGSHHADVPGKVLSWRQRTSACRASNLHVPAPQRAQQDRQPLHRRGPRAGRSMRPRPSAQALTVPRPVPVLVQPSAPALRFCGSLLRLGPTKPTWVSAPVGSCRHRQPH